MGKLLCEKNLRDVWCRNESVRAEIGQILHTHTHTHTHAAKLVIEMSSMYCVFFYFYRCVLCLTHSFNCDCFKWHSCNNCNVLYKNSLTANRL